MAGPESRVSKLLAFLRVDSIKRRLVLLAVLATLIPSFSTAAISYVENRRALTQKITGQLRGASSQAARELDLWLKERLYDLRVFASSYEVSENLDGLRRSSGGVARRRLANYLSSVKDRFTVYHELVVVDRDGRIAASSASRPTPLALPDDWVQQVQAGDAIMGRAYWDSTAAAPLLTVAVPIAASDSRFLGALAAKLTLGPFAETLRTFAPDQVGTLSIVSPDGGVLFTSAGVSEQVMRMHLGRGALERLRTDETVLTRYQNHAGDDVVGALTPLPRLDWSVVAELPSAAAFAQITRLRNLTLLTVFGLLLVIGALAYVLGLSIARPLDRLARAARQVTAGNLSVELPVAGGGELGYVTQVFNEMVARIRSGREELEKLSRTDALTGLPNRRHLLEIMEKETRRAARNMESFAVLMIDVDHFKSYNDRFGHQAGDEVLVQVAAALTAGIRASDYAARYGGEEFIVLLPETSLARAAEVAARIRENMAARTLAVDRPMPTLSMGIAEFPLNGATWEALVASADQALYAAKQAGRDRLVTATEKSKARKQAP